MINEGAKHKWLGEKGRCKITNLEGTIVSHSSNLFGCDRFFIQPPLDKDGKHRDGYWVDEQSIDILPEKKIQVTPTKKGGFNSKVR